METAFFSFKGFNGDLIKRLSGAISVKLNGFSLRTFLLGICFPNALSADEAALLKKEFQFALVKELERKLKARADFEKPQVQIIIDFDSRKISFSIASVFLYGVYKKFSRKLAQTIFYCPKCRGKGCKECSFRGKLGIRTVQELIAKPCMQAFKAKDNKFHGSGREDVDARMLGNGREFVLELIEPKKRKLNPKKLQKEVNKKIGKRVLVSRLCFSDRKMVEKLKEAKHEKIYLATVSCKKTIEKNFLKELGGKEIVLEQRTPHRVSGRRADLVRERKAIILQAKQLSKKSFSMKIQAEAGLYVKEFISGDDGRTIPSVSSIIENDCRCKQLDVVRILR